MSVTARSTVRFHAIEDHIWGLIEEATERSRRTVDRITESDPEPT
jgi:hypothetical protein